MLCDFHTHLYDSPDYAQVLVETAQNLGVDKMCVAGGERRYGLASNGSVLDKAHKYPDLFLPFAYVQPGEDGPRDLEKMKAAGFRGLRLAAPEAAWNDTEFYPLYEAAAALKMPILFHTRILPRTPVDGALGVDSDFCRPICLDRLAREFPDLKIVGTGLGVPWSGETAELMAVHENVYFDLSGDVLARKGIEFFTSLLGNHSSTFFREGEGKSIWSKVVFGTGVRHDKIASVERDYQRLFRALALPENVKDDIMGENAAGFLSLS